MQAQTAIEPTASGTEIQVPTELDTPRSKLVYLALSIDGGSTVDDLRRQLDMGKLTLFPILGGLEDRGLVERDGDRYVTY